MKDSIIDKVKKLLSKAGSTDSPSEAEALFTAAQKLMVKHRIAQNDLDEADQPTILKNEVLCFANRLEGNWELRLARTLSRPNGCDYVYSKIKHKYTSAAEHNKISFYGTEQDTQLVQFFFETTRETFRRLARSEYRRLNQQGSPMPPKNQFIRSFLLGACDGLASKITKMTADHVQEVKATTYDLALRNQLQTVQDYIKTNLDTKTVKATRAAGSSEGYAQGVKAGKAHTLHIPVATSTSSRQNKLS
jgi:hypothetical protein